MHPVPEVSGAKGSHKLGDEVLTFGRLTTVSLAAQQVISNIADEVCSLKSCGHLDFGNVLPTSFRFAGCVLTPWSAR